MKLGNKLTFGVSAVQAGQKSATVNAVPQLIASSTLGKFTVTAPVSKALNVAVGENIMFVNNISEVETAIQTRHEEIVKYAEENGIDLNTREGVDAVAAYYTQWFIAKGIKLYNKTGEPVLATERFTKADKAKYLELHALEIVAANRDALVEQFGEMSDEELAANLTVDMVESPKYHSAKGSKTATTGSSTGVGCQLNFTDSAVWNTLKADLGENKEKKNRIFAIDLNSAITTTFNNGYENVEVVMLPIDFDKDVDPIVRTAKTEA